MPSESGTPESTPNRYARPGNKKAILLPHVSTNSVRDDRAPEEDFADGSYRAGGVPVPEAMFAAG